MLGLGDVAKPLKGLRHSESGAETKTEEWQWLWKP